MVWPNFRLSRRRQIGIITPCPEEKRMNIPMLRRRNFISLSARGGEGRGEVAPLLTFPLSHLLVFLLLFLALPAPATVFTTNLGIAQ